MGLEEALILLYLLVDDAYRMVTFGGRLRQRGPEPKLFDVEVLTMEIFGEQQGRHAGATHEIIQPEERACSRHSRRPACDGPAC